MKINLTTNLNLAYPQDRRLFQGILNAYNDVGQMNTQDDPRERSRPTDYQQVWEGPVDSAEVPADLDIASGDPKVPPVVTVWTSEGNEELAKDHLNVNDTVGRVDVRLANEEDDKAKRTRKPRKDKGKPRIKTVGGEEGEINLNAVREKLDAIKEKQIAREQEPVTDPKEGVEAVVNVKTDNVEMEGSIDEALTAIDPEKPEGALISDGQVARLRELRVEAAKLDVFPEFRKIIVDSYGQAGKFTEIPLDVADRILPELQDLVKTAAEEPQERDTGLLHEGVRT